MRPLLLFAALLCTASLMAQTPAERVNPLVGTTNPEAICPQGMLSVVPFNVMDSDKNRYAKDARWWSTHLTRRWSAWPNTFSGEPGCEAGQ